MAVQSTLRSIPFDRFSQLFDSFYERLAARIETWQGRRGLSKRTLRLLAALAFALSIVSGGYGGYKYLRRRKRERDEGRKLVRRNSSRKLKDGGRVLYVPYKDGTSRVEIHPTKATTFDAHRRLFLNPPAQTGMQQDPSLGAPPTSVKPGLNLAFLHQFMSLMSIMVPRWRSQESGLLASHAVALLFRTYLSLTVAKLDGELVRDIVAGKGTSFLKGIGKWFIIGGISSWVNSQIQYLQSKISIAFRTRLTRYIHDLYLNPSLAYYKLHSLDGGIGQGADHFITQDLTLFCDKASILYSSIGKPLVDLVVFSTQLYHSLGPLGLGGLLVNYCGTATLLNRISPPFGRMKAVEGKYEGEFRALHARLIANAEEVAFYAGGPTERALLDKGFKDLTHWTEGISRIRVGYNMLEDIVIKYGWSAIGYLMTSLPVFLPALSAATQSSTSTSAREDSSHRMRAFITNKKIMLSLADAGARMMYSIKDLAELAGYTSRVYTLISTLHRVHANHYPPSPIHLAEPFTLSTIEGSLAKSLPGVRLENVPLVAPAPYPLPGDPLTHPLTFHVAPDTHTLITGPNGAGKSAIPRTVAGLWPTYAGITSRPRNVGTDGVMFLPQRPYLTTGTLRDQVIYPHTEGEMREAGRTDAELAPVLEAAKLGYLPAREGGWDTRKSWQDVLSGGEKQRMALARLVYHEPAFAFVDEGTSAVSQDVEGGLYEMLKGRGVTLISVSTRVSLKKYHEQMITLGLGPEGMEWEVLGVGSERERVGVEKEVGELREKVARRGEWERRLEVVRRELAGEAGAAREGEKDEMEGVGERGLGEISS